MITPKRCLFIVFCILFLTVNVQAKSSVLFDQGHRQAFLVENHGELDLSKLAEMFTEEGVEVISTIKPLNDEILAEVDALVISGPFVPLTQSEAAAVVAFVREGGKLSLMLHIAQPLAALMMDMGVMHSNGVIREQENRIGDKMTDFFAATSGQHPIVVDLDRFSLFGAWAVAGENDAVQTLAATSAHGWVDLNNDDKLNPGDAMQQLGVAVAGELGRGEFVVFGDDAIFQNRFLHNENKQLARNLVRWISQDKGDI